MQIIVFGPSGDEVIETDVVEEAEKILRDYVAKHARVATEDGRDVDLETPPYPEKVYVLWPMSGGK